MSNWRDYKNKTYTQNEARKMDYEIDLMHDLIAQIYNDDQWTDKIKQTLDKINRAVDSKPSKIVVS